jgi:uncharacterized protein
MTEQFGYIKALDGSPLFAAYHAPAPGGNERALPVVIAPPLFEERKSAYGPLRRLANRLAGAGHAVMRFDYRGSGESGGEGAKRRLQHMAEDVAVVRKTLARMAGKRDAALVGLRLGGTLVLQETIRSGGEAVVALAPIVKGATQVRLWKMRSKIRAEMTAGAGPAGSDAAGTIDFDGFDVHPGFFDDVAGVDLVKDLAALSCSGRVIQISHRTEAAPENTQLVQTLGSRAKLECLRMEAFWDKLDDVDTTPLEDAVLAALG